MRDSVPSASYSSVCNVLRQWNISLIPTYRVYRLYDIDAQVRQNFLAAAMFPKKCGAVSCEILLKRWKIFLRVI